MLMYDSVGPNPRMVRMFMAEKGFEVPTTKVDIRGGENRQGPYLEKNPSGQTPALLLDNGKILSEITAICEYVDEVGKGPSLIGSTPRSAPRHGCGRGGSTSTSSSPRARVSATAPG